MTNSRTAKFKVATQLASLTLALLAATPAAAQILTVTPQQKATADQVAQSGVALSALAANAPENYSIKAGDTLWGISTLFLKSAWRWPELWGMNLADIKNPHRIYPGQKLSLEKKDGRVTLRAVADAAAACGRTVVVVGRAMERTVAVARECGYLDGVPTFLSAESFGYLDRSQIVILATGSQGESRAALARIAANEHPEVKLTPGDRVIFSSRTIPGNEKGVGEILNGLITQGVQVVTDRDGLVHVSGHPRRAEVQKMYDWIRPQIAIPAHGEAIHLSEHARFAQAQGVNQVIPARNGDLVLLGPGKPGVIDQVPHGRLAKDGNVLVSQNDEAIRARISLSFAGIVSVAIAINDKGDVVGDPDVMFTGLPMKMRDGKMMDEIVDEAIFSTLDSLPRSRRKDADATAQSVERAIRNTLRQVWGKKPMVHVLVVEV